MSIKIDRKKPQKLNNFLTDFSLVVSVGYFWSQNGRDWSSIVSDWLVTVSKVVNSVSKLKE